MWKYTVRVTGMMCGMCESHVNDAVRTEGAVVASGIFSGCAVISEGNKRNRWSLPFGPLL